MKCKQPLRTMSYLSKPVIIFGVVKAIQAGIATRSIPPQLHGSIELTNVHILRGAVEGTVFQFNVEGEINFKQNQSYVFFGHSQEEIFAITGFSEDSLEVAKKNLESAPYSWNGAVSPFKTPFKHPELIQAHKPIQLCTNSGYPYYKLNEKVTFKAEKIIPPNAHEYKNPYGDGEFTITLKNTDIKPITTPIFVGKKSNTVYGEQSLIIECDGVYYVIDEAINEELDLLTLQAGEFKQFTINTLKLIKQNFEFPNGGSRVYFNFIIGGQSAADFFYFYSSVHDDMVKQFK